MMIDDTKEETAVKNAYIKMCEAMIAKDETGLNEVLDDSFVLVHMTGMRQNKQEFIRAVSGGTLNYFSARHDEILAQVNGDTALLTGRTYVAAAVITGACSRSAV